MLIRARTFAYNMYAGTHTTDEELPGFRAAYEKYVCEMVKLGSAVMRAMAVSLHLPEDYFETNGLTNETFWYYRMIGYPPVEGTQRPEDDSIGCGEHTDYGCLTIVNQDATQAALQVCILCSLNNVCT
jgi:isopenicillin N synthase-like dioxygenase